VHEAHNYLDYVPADAECHVDISLHASMVVLWIALLCSCTKTCRNLSMWYLFACLKLTNYTWTTDQSSSYLPRWLTSCRSSSVSTSSGMCWCNPNWCISRLGQCTSTMVKSRLSISFRFARNGRNIPYQFKKRNKTEQFSSHFKSRSVPDFSAKFQPERSGFIPHVPLLWSHHQLPPTS